MLKKSFYRNNNFPPPRILPYKHNHEWKERRFNSTASTHNFVADRSAIQQSDINLAALEKYKKAQQIARA